MPDKIKEARRALFEASVIKRMKEGGFLEVEIRVECLSIGTDGAYHDSSVDTYWHYFNAALDAVEIELPELVEPEPPEDAFDDSWRDGYAAADRYRKKCRAAIESADLGLRIK